jgi:hypothetical protein
MPKDVLPSSHRAPKSKPGTKRTTTRGLPDAVKTDVTTICHGFMCIVPMPVLYPLPDIPVHVIQLPVIGVELSHRRRCTTGVLLIPRRGT